ncbi:hypothetical protein [Belnapia rosea]|jgi:hypothetical protein|uniref:hypothetical protein n=1 Tax=Belnapia rosea TaxID=938405 RepID=UPI0015A0C5C5|nr:hypothetical protein [Belnapia rosea]
MPVDNPERGSKRIEPDEANLVACDLLEGDIDLIGEALYAAWPRLGSRILE